MKLSLKNFRSHEDLSIDWDKILIDWKNGEWKSNILYAIERVLFGTIQWRKQGIAPITFWKSNCLVNLTVADDEYERSNWNPTAYLDPMYRPIIFCNLLDQEYTYIKKVLAEIVIAKQAKELFGAYWKWSIDMTIKEIKKEFTVKNKRFIDVQNRVSFLNEQIERLSQYTPEAMVSLEEEYLVLKEKFDTLTPNENIEEALINEWKAINENIRSKEAIINQLKVNQQRSVTLSEQLAERGKKLASWTCPTCWQKFSSQEEINKLREEYKTEVESSLALGSELDKVNQEKQELEFKLQSIKQKILDTRNQQVNTINEYEDIKSKTMNAYKIYTEYNSILTQKIWYEQELDKLINDTIKYQEDPIFTMNEYIAPKGKLNQILAENVTNIFPGIEIDLFSLDSFGESKSTFNIKLEWIDYKELSRSQKLALNIQVSNNIMKKIGMEIPLCIDDAEMFSSEHFSIVASTLNYFIATKVSDNNLSIDNYNWPSKKKPSPKKKPSKK